MSAVVTAKAAVAGIGDISDECGCEEEEAEVGFWQVGDGCG